MEDVIFFFGGFMEIRGDGFWIGVGGIDYCFWGEGFFVCCVLDLIFYVFGGFGLEYYCVEVGFFLFLRFGCDVFCFFGVVWCVF